MEIDRQPDRQIASKRERGRDRAVGRRDRGEKSERTRETERVER